MASPSSGKTPRAPSAFAKRTGEEHLRRLSAFEVNPEVEAVVRKLIRDPEGNLTASHAIGQDRVNIPDPAYLRQLAGTLAQDTTDATSLMQLLPDLELVKNLLISSIMAPKDLVSSEVNFGVDRRAFHLPISGRMLDAIVDHFTNVYNIKGLCPEILEDVLFLTGSYPLLVIPENAVDELINGTARYSTESFASHTRELFDQKGEYRPLGILGTGYMPNAKKEEGRHTQYVNAMESLRDPGMTHMATSCYANTLGTDLAKSVIITDNFNVAKSGALLEAKRQARIQRALRPSLEAADGNYALGGIQRSRQSFAQASVIQIVKTKEMVNRPMVGHPLVMKVPSEAAIPVFITPNKHLGYFLLLDVEGNFIRLANRRDIYNDLTTQNNGVGSGLAGASQMIQMAQNLSIGVNPTEAAKDPAQMVKIYGQLLEHELKTRLANGLYGEGATVEAPEEIYQVMLARSLKRQQTQMVYVPASLLTYIAFDYAENGTGRSLTEKAKIIGSMRAMLGFANVMAGIKNSVSRQRVNLTLSDNDIDPSKTIARTMDEFTRRRNVTMPFVASDPSDMISYINMAGVEWNVEGKGAPAHKVEVEDKVSNRAKVDADLDNMLRDRHYMAFGVTPETVLASVGADFATTVVTNNQMFAKRVITLQDKFTPYLERVVKSITRNSATLLNKLYEIVLSSTVDLKKEGDAETSANDVIDKKGGGQATQSTAPQLEDYDQGTGDAEKARLVEVIVNDFIESLTVSLPRPDTQTLESQINAFEKMSDAIDKALSYILDPAFMGESNLGEFAGHLEEAKAAVKAHYMRQWMRQNGYLPELEEITSVDEDGKPEFDLLKSVSDHTALIAQAMKPYLERVGQLRGVIKKEADALNTKYPDAGLTGAGASGDFGATGGGGESGFGGSETGSETGDELGGEMPPDVTGAETGLEEPGAVPSGGAAAEEETEEESQASELTTGESTTGKSEEDERRRREADEEEEEP